VIDVVNAYDVRRAVASRHGVTRSCRSRRNKYGVMCSDPYSPALSFSFQQREDTSLSARMQTRTRIVDEEITIRETLNLKEKAENIPEAVAAVVKEAPLVIFNNHDCRARPRPSHFN
jgi:hypothetical protein